MILSTVPPGNHGRAEIRAGARVPATLQASVPVESTNEITYGAPWQTWQKSALEPSAPLQRN
jgi:hypothetical protein